MANTTNEKVVRTTKAQRFEDIKALLMGENVAYNTDTATAIEFIDKELAQLAKKNAAKSSKMTNAQKENENYKTLIVDYLEGQSEGRTCTEIAAAIPELSSFNNQKISALMRQLQGEKKVEKAVVKGKSLFTILA